MTRGGRRWRLLPRRGGDRGLTRGDGVDRRTVLVGAAATAGTVAVGAGPQPAAATPAVASLTQPASAALGGAALVAAADVSVVPAGEIIDTDAQSVLEALDRRMSKVNLIDDLQVAVTLVDDFMGGSPGKGRIGELGWSPGWGATGTAEANVVISHPGLFTIGTGTSASGWQVISLGNHNLRGAPVFMCEWRLRVNATSTADDAFSCWVGLHNNTDGGDPTTGIYFRYTPGGGPNWQAVCAQDPDRTVVDTGVPADIAFHRFRFTSDGAGIARFYIDSVPVATIASTLPTARWHAPCASIAKNLGTGARAMAIDYFALRWEQAR